MADFSESYTYTYLHTQTHTHTHMRMVAVVRPCQGSAGRQSYTQTHAHTQTHTHTHESRQESKLVKVVDVAESSPAEKGGLKRNSLFVEVNGVKAEAGTTTAEEIAAMVRGPTGSPVGFVYVCMCVNILVCMLKNLQHPRCHDARTDMLTSRVSLSLSLSLSLFIPFHSVFACIRVW